MELPTYPVTPSIPDPPHSDEDLLDWANRLTASLAQTLRRLTGTPGLQRARRLLVFDGPDLTTADVAISAGWGATATRTPSGNDTRGAVAVLAQGAGQAANATITITFRDGPYAQSPFALAVRNDANLPVSLVTWATTTTTLVLTFPGLPVAGTTYTFAWIVLG